MKSLLFLSVLFLAFSSFLLAEEDHDHGHKSVKPKNGGQILEVGEHAAHLEVVQDEKNGKIKVFVLDKEGNAKKISDAPKLNLTVKIDGKASKKQVAMKPAVEDQKETDSFVAEDAIFKTEDFEGKIAIKIDGKPYQVKLSNDEHKGHNH